MNNDEFVAKLNDLDKKSFKEFIYNRNENNIDFEKVLILRKLYRNDYHKRD